MERLGVQDFSGGYVIHLAAGASGFVAGAVVIPSERELIAITMQVFRELLPVVDVLSLHLPLTRRRQE